MVSIKLLDDDDLKHIENAVFTGMLRAFRAAIKEGLVEIVGLEPQPAAVTPAPAAAPAPPAPPAPAAAPATPAKPIVVPPAPSQPAHSIRAHSGARPAATWVPAEPERPAAEEPAPPQPPPPPTPPAKPSPVALLEQQRAARLAHEEEQRVASLAREEGRKTASRRYTDVLKVQQERPNGYVTTDEARNIIGREAHVQQALGNWIYNCEVPAVIVTSYSGRPTKGCPGRVMVEKNAVIERNRLRLANAMVPPRMRKRA